MIVIERLSAPVTQAVGEQVLDLVAENVTELAMAHPPAAHPFFSVYRLILLTEIRAYLARPAQADIELVTAIENGQLVGFTLCGLSPSGECGVYYTVVSKARRNQGIMSLMMRDVVSRNSIVSLSCDVYQVPRYERYGFAPVSVRKNQIVMVIGDPQEETPILDPDQLQQQPEVLQEQMEASRRSSERELQQANKAMKKFLKAEEAKAKQFLQQRQKQRA
ncbi:GNAT family N-acetyltransferase [Pseudomonas putida]|uniref:GNAT family N-acetyltransferase n=1 Tax=Pseudomonas putida TaxID=303 RepID=UPI0018D8A998|nr:GNAT family N-acetyltransferase [Pseudomonas putida]MBH3349838.1 GNAT family N-acetyltransferase [Pseudomonas putida]